MIDVLTLTRSGITFSVDSDSPHADLLTSIATDALGGVIASSVSGNEPR